MPDRLTADNALRNWRKKTIALEPEAVVCSRNLAAIITVLPTKCALRTDDLAGLKPNSSALPMQFQRRFAHQVNA